VTVLLARTSCSGRAPADLSSITATSFARRVRAGPRRAFERTGARPERFGEENERADRVVLAERAEA